MFDLDLQVESFNQKFIGNSSKEMERQFCTGTVTCSVTCNNVATCYGSTCDQITCCC